VTIANNLKANSLEKNRKSELEKSIAAIIRSERLFMQQGYWYFKTREGFSIGPFDNTEGANQGVHDFLDFVDNTEPCMIKRVANYVNQTT
jgi:Domain of unknown function (DUF6316)